MSVYYGAGGGSRTHTLIFYKQQDLNLWRLPIPPHLHKLTLLFDNPRSRLICLETTSQEGGTDKLGQTRPKHGLSNTIPQNVLTIKRHL